MNIFLDDYRVPSDVKWVVLPNLQWKIVRSYEELDMILKYVSNIDFISFDHDLSEEHYGGDYTQNPTGMECAQLIKDWCHLNNKPFPPYMIHSLNPEGNRRIHSIII